MAQTDSQRSARRALGPEGRETGAADLSRTLDIDAARTDEDARSKIPFDPRPLPTRSFDRWRRDPRVVSVLLAAVAVAAGAWWLRGASRSSASGLPSRATLPPAVATTAFHDTPAKAVSVVVHVAGAVVNPGVVTLPADSRVIDAISRAGGALADADLDRLDLAAKLIDGQQVYVAHKGDPGGGAGTPGAAGGGSGSAGSSASTGPLNLNTATVDQLDALPGIGPALAAAIVRERDRRGGFTSIDDLRNVRGIGDARLADLRDLVTV